MQFNGKVFYSQRLQYAAIIQPFIWIKDFIDTIKKLIEKLIWNELIRGAIPSSEIDEILLTLITFLIFCGFSVFQYYWSSYVIKILLVVSIYWFLDQQYAIRQHSDITKKSKILLIHHKNDHCYWEITTPKAEVNYKEFPAQDITSVTLQKVKVYSGVFSQVIIWCWQISIVINDDFQLIVNEEQKLEKIWYQAQEIANYFDVPLNFLNDSQEDHHTHKSDFLRIRKMPSSWHIYSQWTLKHSWKLMGKAFNKAGLLLFTVILFKFTKNFGQFIIMADLSSLMSLTLITPNIWELIYILLGVGAIIIEGAKISQNRRFDLDQNSLKYLINNKEIVSLPLTQIKSIITLAEPKRTLLICTNSKILEINNLLYEDDSIAIKRGIEEGLKHFEKV
jgi:hypothetical protein